MINIWVIVILMILMFLTIGIGWIILRRAGYKVKGGRR